MINALTNITLKYLIRKEVIDGDNEDVVAFYKYGAEITISSILGIIIVLLISLLCNNSIIEGMLFLLVFIPTRQYTGGFHAETYLSCNLVFASCYFITLMSCKLLFSYISFWFSLIILILELVFIWIFCPIKNRHKPINEKKKKIKFKIISEIFFIVFGIVGLYLSDISKLYSCLILFTLHLIVVMGIAGIIKERSKTK